MRDRRPDAVLGEVLHEDRCPEQQIQTDAVAMNRQRVGHQRRAAAAASSTQKVHTRTPNDPPHES